MTFGSAEAVRVAKYIAENYHVYCLACKKMVVFYMWEAHKASQEHMQKELQLQEQYLKKDPKNWVKKYWPLNADSTRWCPICDRPIRNADWYAHLESHRIKIRKPVF